MLVQPDGNSMPIEELDAAAEYAAEYGNIFVNGAMNSFKEAQEYARLFAESINEPVLWVYRAQDFKIWETPNPNFTSRLQDLVNVSSEAAVYRGTEVTMARHSNAAHICALTSWSFDNFNLFAVGAAHWSGGPDINYETALTNYQGDVLLVSGEGDDVSQLLHGSGFPDQYLKNGEVIEFMRGEEWIYYLSESDLRVNQIILDSGHGWQDYMSGDLWQEYQAFASE